MSFRALDLRSHVFTKADSVFVDTCVWYMIHGPYSALDKRKSLYSSAIKMAIAAKCALYVDAVVISEFTNRYLRNEFEIWAQNKEGVNFKHYRDHSNYSQDAIAVADSVRRILKMSMLIPMQFDPYELEAMLIEFQKNGSDINDLFITDQCKRHGLMLLTDDRDFKGMDVCVITGNEKLLN